MTAIIVPRGNIILLSRFMVGSLINRFGNLRIRKPNTSNAEPVENKVWPILIKFMIWPPLIVYIYIVTYYVGYKQDVKELKDKTQSKIKWHIN